MTPLELSVNDATIWNTNYGSRVIKFCPKVVNYILDYSLFIVQDSDRSGAVPDMLDE
jgi:hypothetical protein